VEVGASHSNMPVAMAHGTRHVLQRSKMHFLQACSVPDLCNVGGIEPAAAQYDDSVCSLPHEGREQFCTFHCGIALSAGKHPADPAADERFQCRARIPRHIEGAMAGDCERAGNLDKRGHALFVYVSFGGQATDDDTGYPHGAQLGDVLEHGAIFRFAVKEVTATWPHDDMKGYGGQG